MRSPQLLRRARALALAASVPIVVTTLPGDVPCCDLFYRVRPAPDAGDVVVTLEIRGFQGDTLVLTRPSARPLVGLLGQDPEVAGASRSGWEVHAGQPRWSYPRPGALLAQPAKGTFASASPSALATSKRWWTGSPR